jgi:hypothetical protein
MAENMEDILMGGFDSDSDDDNKALAPAIPAAAFPSLEPTPPLIAADTSKSDLTNQLKNLYAAPLSMAFHPVPNSLLEPLESFLRQGDSPAAASASAPSAES